MPNYGNGTMRYGYCANSSTPSDEIAALLGVQCRVRLSGGLPGIGRADSRNCRSIAFGRAGGVVARLTWDDYDLLAAYALDGAFRSIEEVRQFVGEEFGVPYTYWGIRSMLDRLGFVSLMPRPIAPQADPEAQEAWKKGA